MSPEIFRARGGCERVARPIPFALSVSPSLGDLPDCERCPIADVVEFRDLLDKVFAEYRVLKRLGIRADQSVPAELLVALDLEVGAIEQRAEERRQRDRKAKEMSARCRRSTSR